MSTASSDGHETGVRVSEHHEHGTGAEPDRVAQRETVVMYNALAYVLAGPLTFGLIGWAVDSFASTSFAIPVGILGGMALSLYYVWFRYGTQ